MYKVTDEEYLSRELLTGIIFDIKDDFISVSSDHTNYCNLVRIKNNFNLKDILDLYSQVVNLAKSKKVRVSKKNKYKDFIIENWDQYQLELKHYNDLFDEVIKAFKEVETRGLHMGTSDDIILDKAGTIKNQYAKVFYRTSTYSKIKDIYYSLEKLIDNLNSSAYELIQITI
jgi:hypothetical protein